ncbi:MAG: SIMPL domain-containing protein [Sphingomonas sp.]|uniref:SIMPL domain-containing protein n=1 Tax=Sphingomonas sp. TaxID=28214 RepID=UPI00179055D9|nr:SIMPL domain-containing protein [Sphingomonas sp.]MBA3668042.1 SIMPL domain-containing protein [Sphingomonas sp.]
MRKSFIILVLMVGSALPTMAAAQQAPTASITEMAATPLVRVNIAETLRTPPDEASITVGTQAKAPTAKAAVAANKTKTEKLLATIRAAGIRERDIQTQGIQLQPDYRWDPEPGGRGRQTLIGYIVSNSVQIKTRNIDALTSLLDALTSAGADTVYGPNFAISDPSLLRREARVRGMARGQAEATEYARNNGYTTVRLLSVEEGASYRGTDIIMTGSRISNAAMPPPPPAPRPERDGGDGIVAPGQLETGVSLNLLYRMER